MMPETDKPTRGAARPSASNNQLDDLAVLRRRRRVQLDEEKERERRVDEGLKAYVRAGTRMESADNVHAAKLARLQERIARLDAEREQAQADAELDRAHAVLAMQEAGCTVPELAQLLGVSQKEVTRLLKQARSAPPAPGRTESGPSTDGRAATSADGKANAVAPAGRRHENSDSGTSVPETRSSPTPVPPGVPGSTAAADAASVAGTPARGDGGSAQGPPMGAS